MKRFLYPILVFMLVAVLVVGCGPKEPANHYEAIKEAGKVVIGTSADYPPFEYIDDDGNIAGFDIDLAYALGEEMGLEVEIVDMPFDSLIAAVQEGKIDMSIAAFNYDEGRDEKIDYTIAYFSSVDAFLVAEDFTGEFTAPEDLANYTIAVQTSTTQDGWLTENLVEAGLMSEDDLFRYDRADQAALDVKSGRVDVLMLDSIPAKAFVEEFGGLKIAYTAEVATGPINAIIPDGDAELQEALNKAIQTLLDEGFVDELALKYFG